MGDVVFAGPGVELAGALDVPERGGPVSGVVLVGGSGPSDRHNDVHFPPIRRHLVDAGIAVLSYDKRGVGGSSGNWLDGTLDDLAADATAALDFLRARPGVASAGLFGHSEGGWVVLRAATARDDVPWVVVNGCPGMTPALQDRYGLENELRRDLSPDDVTAALDLYDRLVEAGRHGADFAEATRLIRSSRLPPAVTAYTEGVDERLWGFLCRKQDHDPAPDVVGLRCPLLAVFGGADAVVPVAGSAHLLTAAATHPDRLPGATLTVRVFPGADHRVQVDGGPAPGYREALVDWITGHA